MLDTATGSEQALVTSGRFSWQGEWVIARDPEGTVESVTHPEFGSFAAPQDLTPYSGSLAEIDDQRLLLWDEARQTHRVWTPSTSDVVDLPTPDRGQRYVGGVLVRHGGVTAVYPYDGGPAEVLTPPRLGEHGAPVSPSGVLGVDGAGTLLFYSDFDAPPVELDRGVTRYWSLDRMSLVAYEVDDGERSGLWSVVLDPARYE